MPYFRHRSFVFAPASASLSTPMICSSVNRRLFIHLLPDEQTLLHSGTNLGEQTNATLLEKSKAQPQARPNEVRFYQYAWYYHFKYVARQLFRNDDEAFICASSIGTK